MSKMDKEEHDLLKSFDDDEWAPVRDREKEMLRYRSYAMESARKNKRVNIRLAERDLQRIKEIALREGIPYQTLIAGVLHRYGAGTLREVSLD